MKTPKNLEECRKIAWCFDCIYGKDTLKPNEIRCSKKIEFEKLNTNPIFFLNFDPPV